MQFVNTPAGQHHAPTKKGLQYGQGKGAPWHGMPNRFSSTVNVHNDSCPVWPVFRNAKQARLVSMMGFTSNDILRDATPEEIKKYLTKVEADQELLRLGIVYGSTSTQPEAGPLTQRYAPLVCTLLIASDRCSSSGNDDIDVDDVDEDMEASESEDEILRLALPPLIGTAMSGTPQNWYPRQASINRTFNVLFVPDPHHAAEKRSEMTTLSWVTQDIPLAMYKTIAHLKGHVYKTYENKNTSTVRVSLNEWVSACQSHGTCTDMPTSWVQLWLALRMGNYSKGMAFKFTYMTWETFRDTILELDPECKGWNGLSSVDCIIGGIDYSINYR